MENFYPSLIIHYSVRGFAQPAKNLKLKIYRQNDNLKTTEKVECDEVKVRDTSVSDPTFGIGGAIGEIFQLSPVKVPIAEVFEDWRFFAETVTSDDGSARFAFDLEVGIYKINFNTQEYFDAFGTAYFFPKIEVIFKITDPSSQHHIPLTLTPFGYSLYRGS